MTPRTDVYACSSDFAASSEPDRPRTLELGLHAVGPRDKPEDDT